VVVVDYFSRRALAVKVLKCVPSAADVCAALDAARSVARGTPKYTVTDRGAQFQSEYRNWCVRHSVKPRFGALGKHGSIALVERFILSLKREALPGLVPLSASAMNALFESYAAWYATERPHQGLSGRTPLEVFEGARPAHLAPRLEPRARYPARAPCAAPRAPVRGKRGAKIELILSHPTGASHLPLVRLRRVA
jgi:putative transposase